MIVRRERWGAWVKLDSKAALVAVDREGMRALGLEPILADGEAPGLEQPQGHDTSGRSAPIEVHMAVTRRCGAGCKGCYLDARPDGVDPDASSLEASLDALRDAGVFTVAFGGGEPTVRDDIGELAEAARRRGMTPVVTTSGLGLSDSRIARLRAFEQVNVSYDGAGQTYADVRGFDAASAAERAVERLVAAGIRVGVNVVLTRQSFPALERTLHRARDLGACEGQLLRYKPAGRAASMDYFATRLTSEQRGYFGAELRRLCGRLCIADRFSLRIDCALVPLLSTEAELMADPSRLSRFGIFGCEAAAGLAAVTAEGRVAPCSFAPATSLRAADVADGYGSEPGLESWRTYADDPDEPCSSCPIRHVCKGGCKVVAMFVSQSFGPDPECPRVEQYRRRGYS